MAIKNVSAILFAFGIIFFAVAVQAVPFTDTANRPANINPNTVITTSQNGMWVVTEGSYYAGNQTTESVYVYQDGLTTKMSFLTSGVTFSVVQMPDPSPVIATTTRPANMNPDTVLLLSNGQVLKVISGSYYGGTAKTEEVILYLSASTHLLSFQTSGVVMNVEILVDIDSDGDGIDDSFDLCPNDAANDADDDGICGDVDACPNDPDNDIDADGVCGDVDNCSETANADQLETDDDGIGDACDRDNDNDGQSDSRELSCGADPSDPASFCADSLPWLMLLLEDE